MTNLDLFDAPSQNEGRFASTVSDDAAAASSPNSDIPAPIIALEGAYRAELALRLDVDQKLERINAQMNGSGFSTFQKIDIAGRDGIAMTSDKFTAYVGRVEEYARHALSVDGAPFTASLLDVRVSGQQLVSRAYYPNRRLDDAVSEQRHQQVIEFFSPIALWREIYKSFDPAAQRRAANMKHAESIRSYFGMHRQSNPEMRSVKGRVEVVIRIWTTIKRDGARRLSYNSKLHELGSAMQQVMIDNGVDAGFGYAFDNLCQDLKEFGNRNIVSRERVNLGDGVDIVLGYEAFKLYLPQEFANAVNIFLAEYPQDDA